MILIDGSQGEGGGQMLRSALSLSSITGKPVHIQHIRAGRARPGLARQHVACVRAAAEVCGAEVTGDSLGSQELIFIPGPITSGIFTWDIGSAGACSLVLQTVIPILLHAAEPSQVAVIGGTHNGMAPPFEYLDKVYAPWLHAMGAKVDITCPQVGFYPAGGGRLVAAVQPWTTRTPLSVCERGALIERSALVLRANLPETVAERELAVVREHLHWETHEVEARGVVAQGPGNILLATVRFANATEVFSAVGERGIRSEAVAQSVTRAVKGYLAHTAPIAEHTADQLLLPLALGAGGTFITGPLSEHARTNITIIAMFLGDVIGVTQLVNRNCEVSVVGRSV